MEPSIVKKVEPFEKKCRVKKWFGLRAVIETHTIDRVVNFSNPFGNTKNGFKPCGGRFLFCRCHDQTFVD
jgi:hypothetical protein